jgi:hypothetical protein
MTTINQVQFPKIYIRGVSGYIADVNSSDELLTTGGGSGVAAQAMGPKVCITGPSGYVADVNSSGELLTT